MYEILFYKYILTIEDSGDAIIVPTSVIFTVDYRPNVELHNLGVHRCSEFSWKSITYFIRFKFDFFF